MHGGGTRKHLISDEGFAMLKCEQKGLPDIR
jgi:hypothetical protein